MGGLRDGVDGRCILLLAFSPSFLGLFRKIVCFVWFYRLFYRLFIAFPFATDGEKTKRRGRGRWGWVVVC